MTKRTHYDDPVLIIASGGETIKLMQNDTGCKINVTPATGADIQREIGLVGPPAAIEEAKRVIWNKVDTVVRVSRTKELLGVVAVTYLNNRETRTQRPVEEMTEAPTISQVTMHMRRCRSDIFSQGLAKQTITYNLPAPRPAMLIHTPPGGDIRIMLRCGTQH